MSAWRAIVGSALEKRSRPGSVTDEPNAWDDITGYNNYYEFGTRKEDPARYAHTLVTDPWSVEVTGEAEKTGSWTLEDILAPQRAKMRL